MSEAQKPQRQKFVNRQSRGGILFFWLDNLKHVPTTLVLKRIISIIAESLSTVIFGKVNDF